MDTQQSIQMIILWIFENGNSEPAIFPRAALRVVYRPEEVYILRFRHFSKS